MSFFQIAKLHTTLEWFYKHSNKNNAQYFKHGTLPQELKSNRRREKNVSRASDITRLGPLSAGEGNFLTTEVRTTSQRRDIVVYSWLSKVCVHVLGRVISLWFILCHCASIGAWVMWGRHHKWNCDWQQLHFQGDCRTGSSSSYISFCSYPCCAVCSCCRISI